MQSAIECRGICKVYRSTDSKPVEALVDIYLSIAPGAFHTVIGPSGCGKSTLMWILGGMTEASSGSVLANGDAVNGPSPDRVAMVFQDASLFPWRNLLDNVSFGLETRGQTKVVRYQEARKYIKLVGLEGYERHYPHELSGGMQQRAAIAQALVLDPAILLMDEPFGALDEQTRMAMGDELLRIWEATGKTIVFITHSLQEAVYLSDRITILSPSPGRIVQTLSVPLPRPRVPVMMTWPEFEHTRVALWKHLHDQESAQVKREIGSSKAASASGRDHGERVVT